MSIMKNTRLLLLMDNSQTVLTESKMNILDLYATVSYYAMASLVVFIIIVDIILAFFPRRRYECGYLITNPVYWVVVILLLPFLNIILFLLVYWLATKGSNKTKRK